MVTKNKTLKVGTLGLLVLMLSFSFVFAFGFSSSYSENDPLTVYPGETKDIVLRIKAGPNETDLNIKALLVEDDAGIAQILDDPATYIVNHGLENDGIVNVRLSIPSNAVIGEQYEIMLRFKESVPESSDKMVSFVQSSSTKVVATVVERPPEPKEQPAPSSEEGSSSMWWIILAIVLVLVVIIIVWIVLKNKKTEDLGGSDFGGNSPVKPVAPKKLAKPVVAAK